MAAGLTTTGSNCVPDGLKPDFLKRVATFNQPVSIFFRPLPTSVRAIPTADEGEKGFGGAVATTVEAVATGVEAASTGDK
jgi:hypothetical protein